MSVSVVAGSSTPQWVYDAGAISHGVTASNLVLARILTDTLISRSPHCVLGARYDGNVNLFYVIMTGSGKRGSRWYFLVKTLSAAVALRGSDAKVFGTRNPGTSNASRTRWCLFWHRSIASFPRLTVSQGRNRRAQVRFDKSDSSNFLRTGRTFGRLRLQFAHCRRLRRIGFGAAQRLDTSPRTLNKPKVDGIRGSGVEDRSFVDLMARDLSSRYGNFQRLMALSNTPSTGFEVSIQKRVVKDNPRAD